MALDLNEYVASLEPSAADREQARQMAMWNAAAMLIGGGPNRGQNISQAMLAGSQGYQSALEQARRKRLADLQSLKMAQDMMERERALGVQANVREALNNAGQSLAREAQGVRPLTSVDDEGNAMPSVAPKQMPMDVREKRRMLLERAAEERQAKGDFESASRLMAEADKLRDEFSPEVRYDQEGRAFVQSKTGATKYLSGIRARDKVVSEDIGGKKLFRSEYSMQPVAEIRKTMTPNEIASLAQSERHFAANLNKPQIVESPSGPVGVFRDLTASPVTMGGQPVGPKMSESQKKELQSIDAQLGVTNKGIAIAKETPSAFGFARGVATLTGTIPESLAGRKDTEDERQSRAFVFNIVSKVINERAGAAQSKQELARLRSFLPSETDNAKQVKDKLEAFKSYLDELRSVYANPGGKPEARNTETSVPSPEQRMIGKSYDTPKGRLVWLGDGQWGRP